MRYAPDNVHRESLGEERPSLWYAIWLGRPHAEGSVIIGRTKRLRRHRWHRAFPEGAVGWLDIEGHTEAMEWLLKQYRPSD